MYKIGLTNCSAHASCDKCMEYDECGWCATQKSCGYCNDCELNSCDSVNEIIAVNYDFNVNKSIMFEFTSRLNLNTFAYKCVFGDCGDGRCVSVDVVSLDLYRVMCLLPNLDGLLQNKRFETFFISQHRKSKAM
jgi:hypothetical protein